VKITESPDMYKIDIDWHTACGMGDLFGAMVLVICGSAVVLMTAEMIDKILG
jgi:hypothetical protein